MRADWAGPAVSAPGEGGSPAAPTHRRGEAQRARSGLVLVRRGAGRTARHAPHVLLVVLLRVRVLLDVEVLELLEVVPALDERPERRRVLADAVPAAGRVADLVLRVGDPVLRLERDALDLEDAHLAVL